MVRKWLVMLGILLLVGNGAAQQRSAAPWDVLVPEAVGFDENGTNGFIRPLADVDGDGSSDLLVGTNGGTQLHVLAGPDLSRIIWSSPERSYWSRAAPDLDGDGVKDVWTMGAFSGTGSYDSVRQAGISVVTSDAEFGASQAILSGATGDEVVRLEWAAGQQSANGRVFNAGGGVFLYMSTTARANDAREEMLVGPDQVWRLEQQSLGTSAYNLNTVDSVRQSAAADLPTTITRSDFAKNDLFAIEFAKPHRAIFALAFVDVTGDDVADLLLGDMPRPMDVDGVDTSIGADVWTAYDGATGAVLWEKEGEPAVRQVQERGLYMEPIGDLDGDGTGDLAVTEYEDGPNAYAESSRIVSGADGTDLVAASASSWFVPFGDITGDGAAEFLTIEWGQEDSYSLTLSDLQEELWKTELDGATEPINWVESDELPFSDVSGDGVPDLLMGQWPGWDDDEDEAVEFFLIDGATGATSWRHKAGLIMSAHALADVTGDGLVDLVYTIGIDKQGSRTSEITNHTMRTLALRGADAKTAWSRTVMDPVLAGQRNLTHVAGWSTTAGDVDGDGADDLLIEMEGGCDWGMYVGYPVGIQVMEPVQCEEFHQFLILSGRTGGLLFMLPELGQAQGHPSDPLPPVEQGELMIEEDPKDVPFPAWGLAALCVVAVALRRRH